MKSEHLTPVENNLLAIQKSIKDFQVDNQFAQLRQETHYKTVASANKNVFWFSIVESFGVVAVTAWQVYYIKKLLDNIVDDSLMNIQTESKNDSLKYIGFS